MIYIIDTKTAIENDVPRGDIITEVEKFFDAKYHQHHSGWSAGTYPYLTMGGSGDITGTRPSGFRDYINEGRIPIDWYQISSVTRQLQEPDELTKKFNKERKFKEELL